MNTISISRFSFSLNIPFLLELCFLAEVTWVEICFTRTELQMSSFMTETPLHQDLRRFEKQLSASLIKHLFLFCQQPNYMCGNVFAFHKPRFSLSFSCRIPCSSYTAQINLSSRHKSIFFSSQVSHTHTLALIQLYRQTHADPGAPHLCFTRSFIIAQ